MATAADLVIQQLADDVAALEETRDQLAAGMADLAYENFVLRQLWSREHRERVSAEAALQRYLERRHPSPASVGGVSEAA